MKTFICVIVGGILVFFLMSNGRVKAQERITAGAIECRDKGGFLLPSRSRLGGVCYHCIGDDGIIKITHDMQTGFGGLNINISE